MSSLTNTKLVTHKSCMDGSTCALVFIAAGGKKENILFTHPNTEDVDRVMGELAVLHGPVIVADVSFSENIIPKYSMFIANDVKLLDHHKSAIPLSLYGFAEIEVENKRAGGKMLYDYLLKQVDEQWEKSNIIKLLSYKELVDAADDQDRWIREIPKSIPLAMLHSILGQELFIERFEKNPSLEFSANEQYVLDLEVMKKVRIISDKKSQVQIETVQVGEDTLRIAYVLASYYQSDLGHAIYEDSELNVDAVIMVGSQGISMRAPKDGKIDLSYVAQLNGGGGHKSAGGCQLENILGVSLLDMVKKNIKLEKDADEL